ncbi:MAG: hypothetical protein ACRDH7_15085 [Actinomycetota bacterium]
MNNDQGGQVAEAIMLVCDVCGKPEATTVAIRVNEKNLQKDFCSKHLAELVQGARPPKRGRRPGSVRKAPARRKTATRKPSARKTTTRKKAAPRKRAAAKK